MLCDRCKAEIAVESIKDDEHLTAKEAAALAGVSRQTIWNWTAGQKLTPARQGGPGEGNLYRAGDVRRAMRD